MRHIAIGMTAAAAFALTSCGGGDPAQENKQAGARAAALTPGEYELSVTVDQLRSTDESAPATDLEIGSDPVVKRACVAADGAIAPAMFAEGEDDCTVTDSYVRNGRMSMQLKCTRAGKGGQVMQLVDGDFTVDGFEAKILGSTGFSGPGDYEINRTAKAQRVGDCPAPAAAAQ